MEGLKVLKVGVVWGKVEGYLHSLLHSHTGLIGLRQGVEGRRGAAQGDEKGARALAVSQWHAARGAPVTHHFPKRTHWSQSELGAAAHCHMHRMSWGSVVCWRSGLWPQLKTPPSLYRLSAVCLCPPATFPLPPFLLTHATHTLANRHRHVALDGFLNQIAQEGSQITIAAPSNHPHPQCPVWA